MTPKLPDLAVSDCQQSFRTFLSRCAITIDEARGGEVRRWPTLESTGEARWDAIWRDWETVLLRCSPLLVDKTRRVMASNTLLWWDVWIAAGGQDKRWPMLMRSTGYRKVILQAAKAEGEAGSQQFVERIHQTLGIAAEQGLRDSWPGFPTWKWTQSGGIEFANGGKIVPVPQGSSQVRGPGTSGIHAEELQEWDRAEETLESAIPALRPEGHLWAVCTPRVATYAARIRSGQVQRR